MRIYEQLWNGCPNYKGTKVVIAAPRKGVSHYMLETPNATDTKTAICVK